VIARVISRRAFVIFDNPAAYAQRAFGRDIEASPNSHLRHRRNLRIVLKNKARKRKKPSARPGFTRSDN